MDISKPEIEVIKKEIRNEIDNAFEFAEASPFPDDSEAYEGEYAI